MVLLSDTVGVEDVLQQTPLAVMAPPPSEVTFPPLVADSISTEDIGAVVTNGKEGGAVLNSS